MREKKPLEIFRGRERERYCSQIADPAPSLCQTNGYELTVRGLRRLLVLTPFPSRQVRIQVGTEGSLGIPKSLKTETRKLN